jgi:hypothetical protein
MERGEGYYFRASSSRSRRADEPRVKHSTFLSQQRCRKAERPCPASDLGRHQFRASSLRSWRTSLAARFPQKGAAFGLRAAGASAHVTGASIPGVESLRCSITFRNLFSAN